MELTKYLSSNQQADGPELDKRTLESLEPEHAVPFLKEHMHWVITTTSSRVIDEVDMIRDSQLQVSVWDRIYDLPTQEHRLGMYHQAEVHQEITESQPGGLGYAYA